MALPSTDAAYKQERERKSNCRLRPIRVRICRVTAGKVFLSGMFLHTGNYRIYIFLPQRPLFRKYLLSSLRSSQKKFFFYKRYSQVDDHTETEHTYYDVHRENNRIGKIENIKNAVIQEIDYQRIDGIVQSFSQAYKDIIYDCAACIRDIKRDKSDNYRKYFLRILKLFRIKEKRRPYRNG